MIQTLPQLVTFDEFIEWYPEKENHAFNSRFARIA